MSFFLARFCYIAGFLASLFLPDVCFPFLSCVMLQIRQSARQYDQWMRQCLDTACENKSTAAKQFCNMFPSEAGPAGVWNIHFLDQTQAPVMLKKCCGNIIFKPTESKEKELLQLFLFFRLVPSIQPQWDKFLQDHEYDAARISCYTWFEQIAIPNLTPQDCNIWKSILQATDEKMAVQRNKSQMFEYERAVKHFGDLRGASNADRYMVNQHSNVFANFALQNEPPNYFTGLVFSLKLSPVVFCLLVFLLPFLYFMFPVQVRFSISSR
jgi:hypothetical protein